jgi:hypothetical protein
MPRTVKGVEFGLHTIVETTFHFCGRKGDLDRYPLTARSSDDGNGNGITKA